MIAPRCPNSTDAKPQGHLGMFKIKAVLAYARYALAALATVAFGVDLN
jgi:hypothetical protein